MRARLTSGLLAVALIAIAGCGGGAPDPMSLLRKAKATVDTTPAVHFHLTSSGVQGTGAVITGGDGDARRPDGFAGTLGVSVAGLMLGVQVVSVNGTFYARLPTQNAFTRTDPTLYGFGDPGKLLDPDTGLSNLLLLCRSISSGTGDRYNGEELDEVNCSLPGAAVAKLLTSADPAQPVTATFGIDPNSDQMRRVVLTGPFFSRTNPSTFTLILDNYGENVTVTQPPTTG